MRFYLIFALSIGTALLLATVAPGPEPTLILVHPPTPEGLGAQVAAEWRQRDYDLAEELAASVFHHHGCNDEFAEAVAHNALDNRIPVRVVAAVIIVESTCRPGIVSSEGAVGLMQVVPRVWHVPDYQLKDPEFNIQKGTEILTAYIRRHGVREGLHRYNGIGEGCDACDSAYPDKVLTVAYR